MCQSVQAFTESSSSMKFLGVTVLVALISLGGVNCYSVSKNNLQVGCSVPIEDVWTDLSRGKTSIKRLMLFPFCYSRVASLSDILGTWSFHPVRFVLINKSVNVSSSFKLFVISPLNHSKMLLLQNEENGFTISMRQISSFTFW